MSFQKSAYSVRSRLHLSEVSLPVVVGVAVVAVAVAVVVVYSAVTVANSQAFEITHAQDETTAEQEPVSSPAEDAGVYVHVAGCVVSPGVYEVPANSRVSDAVDAAGGFTDDADASSLNLARVVADGEQIVVSTLVPEGAAQGEGPGALKAEGRVNINTADVDELMTLDGVGEATAKRIVEDRQANGPFATIEDLKRVSGIGDKKFAALSSGICV